MDEPLEIDASALLVQGELLAQTDWLRGLARRLVADADAAEDLVQDTLVAAFERPPVDRGDGLRGWLATVARNLARRRARGREVRRYHERRSTERERRSTSADEELEHLRVQRRLTEAVLALREPYRSAVVLRYQEGLGHRAIAKRLGITPEATRKRVSRGLELLRRDLDAADIDGGEWRFALAGFALRPRGAAGALGLGSAAVGATKATVAAVAAVTVAWLVWRSGLGGIGVAEPTLENEDRRPTVAALPDLPDATPEPARAIERATVAATPTESAPADEQAVSAERLLRGRVTADGAPVAGAQVVVRQDSLRGFMSLDLDHDRLGTPIAELGTDADGLFEVEVARGKPFDVRATAPGFAETVAVDRQAGDFVELTLAPEARVRGRVVRPDGSTVAGATVSAIRTEESRLEVFERTTDAAGEFSVDGLEPGTLWLRVRALEDAPIWRRSITLEANRTLDVELVVEPGASVGGRVVDAITGAPIAGAEVGDGWTLQQAQRTDADGRFRLTGLRPASSYDIHARAPGYGLGRHRVRDAGDDATECVVELSRGVGASGRIVDRAGEPVDDAYVSALGGSDWHAVRSAEDGAFRFSDLQPGVGHALFVMAEGFGTVAIEFPRPALTSGDYALGDLVLQPAALLTARVVDPSGRPLESVGVVLIAEYDDRDRLSGPVERYSASAYHEEREGTTDASGRVTYGDLAPGTYYLAGGDPGQYFSRSDPIRVEAGEQLTDVEVVLDAALVFAGRVVDEQRRPVRGAVVTIMPQPPTEGRSAQVFTDPEGWFEVGGFAAGSYTIVSGPTPLEDGLQQRPMRFVNQRDHSPYDSPLEIVLPYAVFTRGHVIDADEWGVAGVPVVAFSEAGEPLDTTTTDETGAFELDLELEQTVQVYAGPVGSGHPSTLEAARAVAGGVVERNVRAGADSVSVRLD